MQELFDTRFVLPPRTEAITAFAWSRDGALLVGIAKRQLLLWDGTSGKQLAVIPGEDELGHAMAFSPDCRRLAVLLKSGSIGLWDIRTGGRVPVLSEPMFGETVCWSPEGDRLVGVLKDGSLGIWQNYSGSTSCALHSANQTTAVAWAPRGGLIATADSGGQMSIWNELGRLKRRVPAGRVTCVTWSPAANILASTSDDNLVKLWNIETGEFHQILHGHEDEITGVAFSPDGTFVASKSLDRTVRVWDTSTGQCQGMYREPAGFGGNLTLAFDPTGEMLASVNADEGSIHVHSVREAQPMISNNRTQIFISYSHEDDYWFDVLMKFFTPMKNRGLVDFWSDKRIKPGTKWRDEIQQALASARVAVLLVTQAFLASDFINNVELKALLRKAHEDGLTIYWIAVSHSTYKRAEFEGYQAANDPKHPLDSLSVSKRNAVLARIALDLEDALQPSS